MKRYASHKFIVNGLQFIEAAVRLRPTNYKLSTVTGESVC